MSAFALTEADLLRVSRDLAYSDLAAMPGIKACLGPRISADPHAAPLSWTADLLDLDSLARMQLATAAATWCNAYDAGFEDLFLAKRTAADWAVVMRRARCHIGQYRHAQAPAPPRRYFGQRSARVGQCAWPC
jgi:hypothetical protein